MRILMVTQWFDPEPTLKGLLFAKALQRCGHSVTVITGFPNYPEGRVYPGYRMRWRTHEVVEGIDVIRVPLYPSHDRSGVKRAANYLTFATSAALACLTVERPDVAYVYHPPATVGLPAAVLQGLRGVPFVYDVQDLWPDTLAATGMLPHARALDLVGHVMSRIYRRAAHVVVLSTGFRERLVDRGVASSKITVVPNWTDEEQISPSVPLPADIEQLMNGRFNIVFAGTMGQAQGLNTVLDAAGYFQETQPDVQFVLVGGGTDVDRLKNESAKRGLENVAFLPRRPFSAIGPILGRADALLVHLKDDPLFRITIPSKTQAYLMMGRPILMGVAGDGATLVDEAGAGVSFSPENPEALRSAVDTLRRMTEAERDDLGVSGQDYYWRELALQVGVERLVSLLQNAAQSGGRHEPLRRLIDVSVAIVGLLASAAPAAILAYLIRYRLGSPVLLKQEAVGRYGQAFKTWKFRTWPGQDTDRNLPGEQRPTKMGRIIRITGFDELPKLLNVFRGEMSLTGPSLQLLRDGGPVTSKEPKRFYTRPGLLGTIWKITSRTRVVAGSDLTGLIPANDQTSGAE